jgi:hypothetical protein
MAKCHLCAADTLLHHNEIPVCVKSDQIVSEKRNKSSAGEPNEAKRPPLEILV